jgi:hypothetical protein
LLTYAAIGSAFDTSAPKIWKKILREIFVRGSPGEVRGRGYENLNAGGLAGEQYRANPAATLRMAKRSSLLTVTAHHWFCHRESPLTIKSGDGDSADTVRIYTST